MATQSEIRARITNQIVEALRTGQLPPWRRPWREGVNSGMPSNAVSKKGYRGINVLLLSCQPYGSRWWATYRQWRDLGCQVRKDEKATRIVFWKPIEKQVVNDAGEMESEAYLLLREYCVFNVEQVEGKGVAKFLDQPSSSGREFVDFVPAEEAIQATGADILFADGKAFYNPLVDYIQVPPKSSFENQVGYYATLAHELAHWTGHETRLA